MTTIFKKNAILKHQRGGPYGLGDPDDQVLEFNERRLMVPAFEREILVRDYCSKWNDEFTDCRQNNYWTKAVVCRRKFSALKSCLKEFWDLPHIREQAEKEYLEERSMYRLTGLKRSEREKLKQSQLEENQSLGQSE